MARAKLGDMLSVLEGTRPTPEPRPEPPRDGASLVAIPDETPGPGVAVPDETAATEPASPRATRKPARAPQARARVVDGPAEPPGSRPRYFELERKEVRMRDDQLEALTSLSRRLNKRRRGRGERITENTLIRVAIDILLDQHEKVAGFTEHELRDSVGV